MMPKYLRIATDLRRKIANKQLRPGDALPTRKALMEQYGVAGVTVKQSLDTLRYQGLVYSRRGAGTYVAEPAEPSQLPGTTVGLACLYGPGVGSPGLVDQLLSVGKVGEVIQSHIRAAYFAYDDVASLLEWARPLAGVLVWKYVTPVLVRQLQAAGKQVAVLGAMVEGDCPAGAGQFDVDIPGLIYGALDFLSALGHSRIVLINRRGTLYRASIGRAFAEYAAAHRLSGHMSEYVLEDEQDEPRVLDLLRSAKPRPTAILADDCERCSRLVYHLQRAGLRVPDQISLLGITTSELAQTWMPHLTYAGHSFDEILVLAIEGLSEMLRSGCAIRRTISGRVHRGDTCARVADNQSD